MKEKVSVKSLVPLFLLDFIGAILVVLGLAEWFAYTNFIPQSFQFENYYVFMVVCGVLLMLPALMFIVKLVINSIK